MEPNQTQTAKGAPVDDPRSLSTPELVAFIARHHASVRQSLPYLSPLAAKVAHVHGDHDPRLREVQAEFAELRESLDVHLDGEEQMLLQEAAAEPPDLERLRPRLTTMRKEHEALGAALRRLRELSDGYTPPDWACSSYRTLLYELHRLEDEVLRQIQVEDEVLMPRLRPASGS